MEYKAINSLGTHGNGSKRVISDFLSRFLENKDDVVKYAFDFTQGRCFYCGRKMYKKTESPSGMIKLTKHTSWDHLHTVTDLGLFVKGNILLTCKDCNSKRGCNTPQAFYKSRFMNTNNDDLLPLYDTYSEFCAALSRFELPYIRKYPELYKINFDLENNIRESVPLSEVLVAINMKDIMLYSNDSHKIMEPLFRDKDEILPQKKEQQTLVQVKVDDDEKQKDIVSNVTEKPQVGKPTKESNSKQHNIPNTKEELRKLTSQEFNKIIDYLADESIKWKHDERIRNELSLADESFESIVVSICVLSNKSNVQKATTEVRHIALLIKSLIELDQLNIGTAKKTFAKMQSNSIKALSKFLKEKINIGEKTMKSLRSLIGFYSGNSCWFV